MSSRPAAVRDHRQQAQLGADAQQAAARWVRQQRHETRRVLKRGPPTTWWGAPVHRPRNSVTILQAAREFAREVIP